MLPRACQLQAPALNQARINSNMTRRILGCRGLNEIISWSFMSSKKYQLFGEVREELMLANPISSDLDLMRGSIIPNLIDSVKKSLARSFKDLSFFEIGPIFHKIDQQELVAAGIRYGMTAKKNIYHDMRAFDVYDVKADVLEALLGLGITTDEISLHQGGMPNYYHPGRSACLKLGDERIAYFGELHPKLVLEFDLKSPAQIFEIFLDNVKFKQNLSISNELISDFQGIERDYAFIIDKSFPVGNLIGLIKALAPQIITGVYLFDLYQGLNLQESQQSVALTVTIQALDHTLTGAEIEQLHQEIIAEVEGKTGGKLRT
jgi:phenylalanyl-tRNA synthetase beta chain